MINIIIYEDNDFNLLKPFTLNHATFELRAGGYTNFERIIKLIQKEFSDTNISLAVRDELIQIIKEKYPEYKVINKDTISINKSDDKNYYLNGSNVYKSIINKEYNEIKYLWDVININGECIQSDFKNHYNKNFDSNLENIAVVNNDNYISKTAKLSPGVVCDASNGPIIICDNVEIGSNTVLEGPLFIGNNSKISPLSLIRGNTSIGPFCKIGGEVSSSVFQGYTNKVHDGFIGHSYIGEWVNIGAGTNNSNLKNNYGDVKILLDDKIINTRLQFMGILIGDYTRIAIGTNLNTGTYISIGANIFNYSLKLRSICSFAWGPDKKVAFDKFIETVRIMKQRRNKDITEGEKKYLEYLYNK